MEDIMCLPLKNDRCNNWIVFAFLIDYHINMPK